MKTLANLSFGEKSIYTHSINDALTELGVAKLKIYECKIILGQIDVDAQESLDEAVKTVAQTIARLTSIREAMWVNG